MASREILHTVMKSRLHTQFEAVMPSRNPLSRLGVAAAMIAVVVMPLLAGCSQMSIAPEVPEIPLLGIGEDKPVVPDGVIAVWSDSISRQGGKESTRGFAGRIIFYGGEEQMPVKVEGTVVVYAFNERDRKPSDTRPDKKFVFRPEQLSLLHSESKLGHSYSFWLPWGSVNGPEEEISLIVRFEATSGATIVGEQTKHRLPGLASEEEMPSEVHKADHLTDSPNESEDELAVEQASYEVPVSDVEAEIDAIRARVEKMRTTTIDMPARMARKQSAEDAPAPMPTEAELEAMKKKVGRLPTVRESLRESLGSTESSVHSEQSRFPARGEQVAQLMSDRKTSIQSRSARRLFPQHEPESESETASN